MSVYDRASLGALLEGNTYPGRGIVAGMTSDGKKAVIAYFIMGRSENSRNRVFEERSDGSMITAPYDESKVQDPSLIIYSAIKWAREDLLIVTNGDQTDTICEYVQNGKSFEEALESRAFEPDAPNFTPRISLAYSIQGKATSYKMSILKSADEAGSGCNRYTFNYAPMAGTGHFIHTYNHDGNPIPTFTGEPERIVISDDIDQFTKEIWEGLNADNKISLAVRYIDIETREADCRLMNKFCVKEESK
ncbi:MAG: inosine monophosphate cyclohydrolase [Clostridiales bacterium]|nr:inosine monophosphate cyclohydrolase [Clostridiales bacterium]